MASAKPWKMTGLLLLSACASSAGGGMPGVDAGGGAPDAALSSDSGAPGRDAGATDAGSGANDAGGGAMDAGSTSPDAGGSDAGTPPTPKIVRFAALGDAGEGNTRQNAVGARLATVCAARGCDFVMYLGDNFYDSGVSSVNDPQWSTKFEMPYAAVTAPFYPVLGNHDYGADGLGTDWVRGPVQVAYSVINPRWVMPSEYHRFEREHVAFYALDTNAIFWRRTYDDQAAFMQRELAAEDRPWRIGFGHHPYRSVGEHGNAGNYEGLSFIPVANGAGVRDFFEDELCGELDVYFAGHDHSRQWLGVDCGMLHIVSGAGAKTSSIENRDHNSVEYADATEPGFLWVEISGDTLHGVFYDAAGNIDFEQYVTRPSLGAR